MSYNSILHIFIGASDQIQTLYYDLNILRCPIHSKEYKMGKLYILIEIHMLDLHAFDYISLHF